MPDGTNRSDEPADVPAPLEGLRVLELDELVAGPYATKVLADLGADVVKIEPPGGDGARRLGPFVDGEPGPERSVLFHHLNTSKRGLCVDAATPAGRDTLAGLAGDVDLVVTDWSPDQLEAAGLAPGDLLAAHPSIVVLWLTPFGTSGPYRDYKAHPLTTFQGAGEGYLTPVASHLMPEVVDRPPLRQGRFASEYKLATYAASLALAAVHHARATGVGQIVDLSKQDALIGLNFFEFQGYLSLGFVPTRASLAVPFGGIMPCRDGFLQFTFHEEHQWRSLVKYMGDPDWAHQEWAATEQSRMEHAAEINARLGEWLSTMTRDEVVKAGQAIGVTVAPYLSADEVAASEQFAERRFFQPVTHPETGTRLYPTGPWHFSGRGPRPGPPPTLGQHDGAAAVRPPARPARPAVTAAAPTAERRGALAGLRVLDFTWAVAGPTATMLLASLGAEVIKVETALRPDVLRRSPFTGATTNRQKKAITLNLRNPSAIELAKRLVAVSDVVAESFRPGVMGRLGLGYEDLSAIRPDLVMLSSSMGGQTGPYSQFAGYAPMFVALSGLGDLTGYTDGPPTQIRVGGDIIVGVHAGFALMTAIVQRQWTGRGTHIDLSAIESEACLVGDSLLAFQTTDTVPHRNGNDEPGFAPHNCYRCAGDDRWVSIAVATDEEWRRLVGALGDPAWATDTRCADADARDANRSWLDEQIGRWTEGQTPEAVTERLQAAGVAAIPAYQAPELFADPHVLERDLLAAVPGSGRIWPLVKLGGRLSETPLRLDHAGPLLGEHNDEIFRTLLGLSDDEVAAMTEEGVFT